MDRIKKVTVTPNQIAENNICADNHHFLLVIDRFFKVLSPKLIDFMLIKTESIISFFLLN